MYLGPKDKYTGSRCCPTGCNVALYFLCAYVLTSAPLYPCRWHPCALPQRPVLREPAHLLHPSSQRLCRRIGRLARRRAIHAAHQPTCSRGLCAIGSRVSVCRRCRGYIPKPAHRYPFDEGWRAVPPAPPDRTTLPTGVSLSAAASERRTPSIPPQVVLLSMTLPTLH